MVGAYHKMTDFYSGIFGPGGRGGDGVAFGGAHEELEAGCCGTGRS